MAKSRVDPFQLYELAVQSPDHHAEWFVDVFRELRGRYPRKLREDFCGTHALSRAWVSRNRKNSALGLDLDPAPLRYGKKKSLKELNREQRARLEVVKQDVNSVTEPLADIVAACNFSFCVFKKRPELRRYFRGARASLKKDGIIILEIAGGPGMIRKGTERRTIRAPRGAKFLYFWEQKRFNPITSEGKYAIHFELPGGKKIKNAFTYDWRLWSLPELREILLEAGFSQAAVYWETEHQGKGTGEYLRTDKGDNSFAWIAYVVGLR